MSVEQVNIGDVLVWEDPDGGVCSRRGTVTKATYGRDGTIYITWEDGTDLECFMEELSHG